MLLMVSGDYMESPGVRIQQDMLCETFAALPRRASTGVRTATSV